MMNNGLTQKKPFGSPLEKDAKKFIENDGSKRYRISTHPDFVICDHENLVNHPAPRAQGVMVNKTKNKKHKYLRRFAPSQFSPAPRAQGVLGRH